MKKLMLASCLTVNPFLVSALIYAAADVETKDFPADGLTEVEIESTSGKIVVIAADEHTASISAKKNRFSAQCNLRIERTTNKLNVKLKDSAPLLAGNHCDVDFEVRVPRFMELDLELGSGSIKVDGIQGELEFKTGNGDVNADGSFHKVDGKVANGRISINGLTGGGELKLGNGQIDLKFASAPTHGDIEIKAANGDATLEFPKGAKIRTNLQSGMGKVSNELGESRAASFTVLMKSGLGNLNIKSY